MRVKDQSAIAAGAGRLHPGRVHRARRRPLSLAPAGAVPAISVGPLWARRTPARAAGQNRPWPNE